MKYFIFILIVIGLFISCSDHGEQQNLSLNCDVFDYKDGIIIHSAIKIKEQGIIIKYQKNSIHKIIDTIKVNVDSRELQGGKVYSISNTPVNTNYDYQIILNDTIRYFLTNIKTEKVKRGSDFMQGSRYRCEIPSYKINGVEKQNTGNLTIDIK